MLSNVEQKTLFEKKTTRSVCVTDSLIASPLCLSGFNIEVKTMDSKISTKN